jgi:hypothetical protein
MNGLSPEIRDALMTGHFYAYSVGVTESLSTQLRIVRFWLSLASKATAVFPEEGNRTQDFDDPSKIPDPVVSAKMRRAIFAFIETPSVDDLTKGFSKLFDPGFIKNPRSMFRNSRTHFGRATRYATAHPGNICVALTETNAMEILAFWAGGDQTNALFAAARNAKITARGKITSCFAR